MTARAEILSNAAELVNGARDEIYGTPGDNFTRIAQIWSAILGREVTIEEVAMCLAGLKLARLVNSPDHEDSWTDLAGYAAIGGELPGWRLQRTAEGAAIQPAAAAVIA